MPRTKRKTSKWIWACGARLRSSPPPAVAWERRWRNYSLRRGLGSPSVRGAKRRSKPRLQTSAGGGGAGGAAGGKTERERALGEARGGKCGGVVILWEKAA